LALDSIFEDLVARMAHHSLTTDSQAAVMRAARDIILERLAHERAGRGPDRPAMPRRRADDAETLPVLPQALGTDLAAFLAGIGDAAPDENGTIAVLPPDLAAALTRAAAGPLPQPSPFPTTTAAARERAARAKGVACVLEADLAANDLSAAAPVLAEALMRLGLQLQGTARHLAGEAAMTGMIEAYRSDADRHLGVIKFPEGMPLLASGVSQTSPGMHEAAPERPLPDPEPAGLSPRMRLGEAFTLFLQSKKVDKAWNGGTQRDAETAVRLFIELFGDRALEKVTRAEALNYRAQLAQICSCWGQDPAFADPVDGNPNNRVSAARAVEISKARPTTEARLSPKTIKKYVGMLNGLWNWARENAGCADLPHPFSGLQKKGSSKHNKKSLAKLARQAFRISEVLRIFASPAWSTHQPFADDQRRQLRANASPSLYFGVLLAAYLGLRQTEICQLRVGDIVQFDDFWVIEIRSLSDADYARMLADRKHSVIEGENSIKTGAADRVVPIHPVLIRCGFIDYLRLRDGKPSDLLFTDVSPTAKDRSRKLSRFFTEFKRQLGFNRPDVAFHSFRHTVRTMLDALVTNRAHVDLLIGHDDENASGHARETYNKGAWYRPLFESLSLLTYGIEEFGETTDVVDRMRKDGFALTR
jgi:integrase